MFDSLTPIANATDIAKCINAHLRAIGLLQAMVDDPNHPMNLHKPSAFETRRRMRRIEVLEAELRVLWSDLREAVQEQAVDADLAVAAGAHRARS
jgi:hypothetical protein